MKNLKQLFSNTWSIGLILLAVAVSAAFGSLVIVLLHTLAYNPLPILSSIVVLAFISSPRVWRFDLLQFLESKVKAYFNKQKQTK